MQRLARFASTSRGEPTPTGDQSEKKSKQEGTPPGENDAASEEKQQESRVHKGEAMTFIGIGAFAASMFLRNPAAARILRFAGPGGMLIGAMLSIYELGGWRLLLGLPVAGIGIQVATGVASNRSIETLKSDAIASVSEACPDVPADALEALRKESGTEYETNRLRMEVVWHSDQSLGQSVTDAPSWRFEITAERESRFRPWRILVIRTSRSIIEVESADAKPSAQTRSWSASDPPSRRWSIVWQNS